jgi:hypothetical protein
MSSANESNASPFGERKRTAASDRRRSRATFANDGRYHATIRSPFACAASTNRPKAAGRSRSTACE